MPGLGAPCGWAPRRPVERDPVVDVRARFQQGLNDVGTSFAYGEEKGVEAGVEAFAIIGTCLNEGLHDFDIALGGGPHQGRLLAIALFGADLGAVRE